jgi:hypothetical protein
MTPDRDSPTPGSGDRGVFGNLPSERPGVRSPRRAGTKGTEGKAASAKGSRTTPAAKTPKPFASPRPKTPPPASTPEPDAPEAGSGRGSVEEVAWAGITVAAEAATLGVRLFSRALEAVRERR